MELCSEATAEFRIRPEVMNPFPLKGSLNPATEQQTHSDFSTKSSEYSSASDKQKKISCCDTELLGYVIRWVPVYRLSS